MSPYTQTGSEALLLVNPRRACARVTVVDVCVCVCVCQCVSVSVYLSVPALAASASVEDSKQRYSRVSLRLFLDFDSWIFEKPFRYSAEKPICKLDRAHREPFSRTFRTSGLQERQLVDRILLQTLVTFASGV